MIAVDMDKLLARAAATAASEQRDEARRRAWRVANGLPATPAQTASDRRNAEIERCACPF